MGFTSGNEGAGPINVRTARDTLSCNQDSALPRYGTNPSPAAWTQARSRREPRFHAPGPLKMYSAACFTAIGGLKSGLGWDTIDDMCALMRGFRTSHFPHIRGFHHRPQGAASGALRNRVAQG